MYFVNYRNKAGSWYREGHVYRILLSVAAQHQYNTVLCNHSVAWIIYSLFEIDDTTHFVLHNVDNFQFLSTDTIHYIIQPHTP